jgi:inorganic pyrophosphatase
MLQQASARYPATACPERIYAFPLDRDLCYFVLAAIAPEGMDFPYDFGFIPARLGEDGESLDVPTLTDFPLVMGCSLQIRLSGAIEAEQCEKGKE